MRHLAIDLGAESGRGIVGVFSGDRLELEEVHRFPNPPVRMAGTLYWDFPRLYGDVLSAISAATHTGALESVGVDSWGVDFGLLDTRGRLMGNPVHYRDTRTAGAIRKISERMPREEIYAATGIQFIEINTLYQLFAMAESHDPDLERAQRLLMIPDLINHFLCGSTVGEYTNATTTQCFDVRTGSWAESLLSRLGIPTHLLPEVVQPGSVLARGLNVESGLDIALIAPGTHDTASAVAGSPLSSDGGTAFLSSGTWSLLGLELDHPVISNAALEANLTNEGGVNHTFRLLSNIMGLWLVQEARRSCGAVSYAELESLAARAKPWTAFVDPDDARFLRPGDFRAAVEAFCSETQQPAPEDIGTLVRVVLDSLALKYAWVARQLERIADRQIQLVRVVGGGSHNSVLCQLTADATGLPVFAGPSEATAIGNLLLQAMAMGELGSLAEARELVNRSFPPRCYQPQKDWREARERFASLLASRLRDTGGT